MRSLSLFVSTGSLVLASLTLGGCADVAPPIEPVTETTSDVPPSANLADGTVAAQGWTLLVYASGDATTAGALESDVEQLSSATFAAGMNVVVADGATGAFRTIAGAPAGERLRSAPNPGDPATLRKVAGEVFRTFPAEHRGVFLWTRGRASNAGETASALRAGLADAGITDDRSLDFVAVDGSAAPSIEAAFALKDVARVYMASSTTDGASAFAYADAFGYLGKNPGASASDFARAEATAWRSRVVPGVSFPRAYAAVDTSVLDNVGRASASFTSAVAGDPESMRDVAAAMASAARTETDGVRRATLRDVAASFVAKPNHGAVTAAAKNVVEQLDRAALDGSSAFVVALPSATDASATWAAAYRSASPAWHEASGWTQLMTSFSTFANSAPTIEAAVVDAIGQLVSGDSGAGGARVVVESSTPDLGNVRATLRFVKGGASTSFGDIGEAGDDASSASIPWVRRIGTVGGEDATRFTWRGKAVLAGELSLGGAKVPAGVVVTGGVTSNLFVVHPETGGTAVIAGDLLAVDRDATFTPAVREGDAWRYGRTLPVATAGVGTSSRPLRSGTYEIRIEAESIWGTRTTLSRPFWIGH